MFRLNSLVLLPDPGILSGVRSCREAAKASRHLRVWSRRFDDNRFQDLALTSRVLADDWR
jgi:hypothetical protein